MRIKVLKYIKKYSERNFPIVELGCGVGSKLFVLAKNGFSNLSGYDLTEAGINIAKRYNDKKQYNVNFEIVDLTKKIPDLTGKTIFTVSCLEQLKN